MVIGLFFTCHILFNFLIESDCFGAQAYTKIKSIYERWLDFKNLWDDWTHVYIIIGNYEYNKKLEIFFEFLEYLEKEYLDKEIIVHPMAY